MEVQLQAFLPRRYTEFVTESVKWPVKFIY